MPNFQKIFLSGHLLIISLSIVTAQNQYTLKVKAISEKININGLITENAWEHADSISGFWQNFPYDTSYANSKTVVKVLSDNKFLYIAAICYDNLKGDFVVSSLKRDFAYSKNDAFAIYIDPYNDQSNGFAFAVNPYGVQSEGLIQNGGGLGLSTDWDNKWQAETKIFEGGYSIEISIPFKSIRFNVGDSFWRVNFSRNDLKRNENSSWKPVPRNMHVATLVNAGQMIFEQAPLKQKINAAIIPYVISKAVQPNSRDDKIFHNFNSGLDAKLVLTPALNLDLTVNPDFAQVEVDRQVINLSRFSIFFPERRQFFLENSDLFASFGFRQIRPFFSRTIGLERGINIPIQYGARLSGKIGQNWRVGLMNIQTSDYTFSDSTISQGQNFTVAAAQRRIFGSSNIAFILVNKMEAGNAQVYNRVAGLDYNLQSKNGKWLGKAFWHQSFSPDKNKQSFANATWLYYTDRKFSAMWNHEYVYKDYHAATGFVPRVHYFDMRENEAYRLSYYRLEPEINYKIFPKSKVINNINPSLYSDIYLNDDFSENDALIRPALDFSFQNSAFAGIAFNHYQTRLLFHTDVLGNGQDTFKPGLYNYGFHEIYFQSNKRKLLTYYLSFATGKFYQGDRQTAKIECAFRIQPKVVIGLISSIDYISLPPAVLSNTDRYRTLALVAPSFELSLTRKVFFTTYIQYNSQADNININTRFQYRFKPMSDLFIVYSDNYDTRWTGRNRALTVKLSYWLNT